MPDSLELVIVLVQPKFEGNVGAVARSCANFGLDSLVLIDPPPFGDEAYERALHAQDLMLNAPQFDSLEQAMENVKADTWVATTGKANINPKCHRRNPETPMELFESFEEGRKVALVFGREDNGLSNEEIELCDRVATVPTSDGYPVMNLSHAVTVFLYEAARGREIERLKPLATDTNHREAFVKMFDEFVDHLELPEIRERNSKLLFRRMVSRSQPTQWEFYTLMGVFNQGTRLLKGWKPGENDHEDFDVELGEEPPEDIEE